MNIFKKPGRILLIIMIVLAVVRPCRVHMYKTKGLTDTLVTY